jgi:hypothetical protein
MTRTAYRITGLILAAASIAWPLVDRTGFAPAVLGSLGFALGVGVALFAHK